MNLTSQAIAREVVATGFGAEPLEKVFRLMGLLDALHGHPFLKTRMALKGGTALNLFHFDVPRLSVDINLNYIGAADRDTLLAERPKVEQAVQAVCSREGLTVKRAPSDHAGGKWRLSLCRCCRPEEASIGDTPHRAAKGPARTRNDAKSTPRLPHSCLMLAAITSFRCRVASSNGRPAGGRWRERSSSGTQTVIG